MDGGVTELAQALLLGEPGINRATTRVPTHHLISGCVVEVVNLPKRNFRIRRPRLQVDISKV